ncbi:hypothetical protein KsCSTR_19750 [Candidatus Kuenenia stuttgartiensis]|uniref:Uncharacterized protein n=1 Tax=Kuenenia stuttgartiensis TaxID=174633 RepID=Q1Q2K9_KUEST|nr:hypothetical protein KsCSTR_19750 [Candidatus Kuenenia stuttgartiensis]CAJ74252.1 unknown protein [Candidatus Kuenenia stuttgartiensis]
MYRRIAYVSVLSTFSLHATVYRRMQCVYAIKHQQRHKVAAKGSLICFNAKPYDRFTADIAIVLGFQIVQLKNKCVKAN